MGSELAFWAYHKNAPADVEAKDQEFLQNKRLRGNSVCSQSSGGNESSGESPDYHPEKIEKRRFSLDFILRRGSKGKLNVSKTKRGSASSTDSNQGVSSSIPDPPKVSNQRRRSSTRMEGNSDLAAWCFV